MRKDELRPIVKWAGGKGQLVPAIAAKYPHELGFGIKKYAEPFVGGGAVLFDVLSRYSLDSVYISDINPWLVNMYKAVRDNAGELVTELKSLGQSFLPLDDDGRKERYYLARNRYNTIVGKKNDDVDVEAAALFIFLNRTCFNGLYRVNRQGHYNVPMGAYKNPKVCDAPAIVAASHALRNVEIVCADFEACEHFVDDRTFVYFDPPYRPLTSTASFTSYTDVGFDDGEQKRLAYFVNRLSAKGAYVVVSNSDPKNADPDDLFFDRLYSGHNIGRVQANRMINRDASKRGNISELLISTF